MCSTAEAVELQAPIKNPALTSRVFLWASSFKLQEKAHRILPLACGLQLLLSCSYPIDLE
jgi:hypothetical protein